MTAPPPSESSEPVEPSLPPAGIEAAPPTPAAWPRWFAAVDRFTLILLLGVAGLTACHLARNSDIWLHLATGRDLVNGVYKLGTDPYSFSTEGRVWVHHAWLTDAIAYQLYKLAPAGELLILAKATLFAGAFALVLLLKKPHQSGWPWCAALLVAIVAAAPQSLLRPPVVSACALGLTLVILFGSPWRVGGWGKAIQLAVLFALWANLDAWFLLGPLTVGVTLLGEVVQSKLFKCSEASDVPAKELFKAFLFGTAATLLNPHHVGVWQLPPELGFTITDAVKNDALLKLIHLSPISEEYMKRVDLGANANGVAFALLFIGGGLLMAFSRIHLPLMLVWVLFAALALIQYRFILAFAIVAAPVTASSLCELLERVALGGVNEQSTRLKLLFASILRPALAIAAVVAGLCAWPGWIHPRPSDPSLTLRAGLNLVPDAGLVRSAQLFTGTASVVPASAKLAVVSVPLADYIAWHAPGVKVALNHRLPFHVPELPAHIDLRQAYISQEPEASEQFLSILKKFNADCAVITSAVGKAMDLPNILRLVESPQALKLAHLDGRAVVIAKDGGATYRPGKFAFQSADLAPVEASYTPAPERTPPNEVDDFLAAPKGVPLAALDAVVWQEYASHLWQRRVIDYQSGLAVGTLALAGPGTFTAMRMMNFSPMPQPDGEAVTLNMMALRAARRAIQENPDHPHAYHVLGQAYSVAALPLPGVDREDADMQRAVAFRRHLDRVPPPAAMNVMYEAGLAWKAAESLAVHFQSRRINERPDPSLDLWRETNKLANEYKIRALVLVPRQSEEQMKQIKAEAEAIDKKQQEIDKGFANLLEKYQSAANRPAKDRLAAAMQLGLKGEAMKIIAATDLVKEFGSDAISVELLGIQLLVSAGKLEAAAESYEKLHGRVVAMAESPDPKMKSMGMAARQQLGPLIAELQHLAGDDAAVIGQLERTAPRRLSPRELETVRAALASEASLQFRMNALGHGALAGALGLRQGVQAEALPVRQWENVGEAYTRLGVLNLLAGKNGEAKRYFELARQPEGVAVPAFLGGQNSVAEFYLKLMK